MKISFIGNCQVVNIAGCAQAMVPDATVRSVVPLPGTSLDPARNSDIVFIQSGLWLDVQGEFPGALVKKVPNFVYWGFQPDLVFASVDQVPLNSPMDAYNSALTLYGWLRGLTVSDTVRLFCDAVYDRVGYYDYTEPSRRHMMETGSLCDLDMAPLLDEWNDHGCFTYSINHPKLFVLNSIARAALDSAGITTAGAQVDPDMDDFFARCAWPVYPDIAQRLAIAGDYRFQNRGVMDLEQFVEGSFSSYASVPREKIRVERLIEQPELYRDLEKLVPGRRKASNPYSALPDHCFWQRSVVRMTPAEVDPIVNAKFQIGRADSIATAGSCFAQHIARTLVSDGYNFFVAEQPPAALSTEAAAEKGYGLFSARFGNIYTARQLLQLLQRAYLEFAPNDTAWIRTDGKFIDPFRPQIEPDGYCSGGQVALARTEHFAAVRRMFEESDLFIFTIGLTEAWKAKADGAVFPVAPGVLSGKIHQGDYAFHNFTVAEVMADLTAFIERVRSINRKLRILFTVSPVPLVATYENRHVLVSTTYSKSALRAAVGEVAQKYDFVDYFPSYEVITNWYNGGRYFEKDLRSVTEEGVGHVMRLFRKHYIGAADLPERSPGVLRGKEIAEAAKIICDEEVLDRAEARQMPPQVPVNGASATGDAAKLEELSAIVAESRQELSLLREMLRDESTTRGAQAVEIHRRISNLRDAFAERPGTGAEPAPVEAAIASRLETLSGRHDDLDATIRTILEGIETWLLPTLAMHHAAIQRRRRPARMLYHLFEQLKQRRPRLGARSGEAS